jgi:ribose/xylose/arabinose/galactoside ABC-type transport system permease subunit
MTESVKPATIAGIDRKMLTRTAIAVVVVAAIAGVVNYFTGGALLRPGNLINVLRQITYNCILAIGQTFVIITAGIDLSVGSIISLAGVVMALFINAVPFDGLGLIVATLAVGLAVGAFAGYVNALPVVKLNLPPFITTLAMMQMARGLSYTLSQGRPIALRTTAFDGIGIGFVPGTAIPAIGFPGIPIAVVWMIVVAVAFAILLGRTRFGRYVYAIGGNEEAARLAGVNVGRVKTFVYMISGACAALVGLLLMARFQSGSPQTGFGYELQAIAAAVVGGTSLMGGRGTIVGTFLGALLIGLLYNAMDLLHIESYTQLIVLGAVILLAVISDEIRKRYLIR